jgi:hypothetical protein
MNMFFKKKNNNFNLLSTKFVWTNFADATLKKGGAMVAPLSCIASGHEDQGGALK